MDTLSNLGNHASIDFDSNELLPSLQEGCSQVTRPWTNLQHYVSWLDCRFLDDLLHDERVLEDMLTERFVKLEVVVLRT